jgi:NAD(P)-dependent dehydrogenase (short-subunit alcohol dehydrogenase family)
VHPGGAAGHGGPRWRSHRQRSVCRCVHAGGIYGVSKFALHGLTVNLASELGGRGINVNAIAPGLVDNESAYVALPKDSPFRDAIAQTIPGKPSGPPEDLVGTLLLLCSRAGDWITGQTILVDGGWITRL